MPILLVFCGGQSKSLQEGFISSQIPPLSFWAGCCRQPLWGLGKVLTTLSRGPGCGFTITLGPFQCLLMVWAHLVKLDTGLQARLLESEVNHRKQTHSPGTAEGAH